MWRCTFSFCGEHLVFAKKHNYDILEYNFEYNNKELYFDLMVYK